MTLKNFPSQVGSFPYYYLLDWFGYSGKELDSNSLVMVGDSEKVIIINDK